MRRRDRQRPEDHGVDEREDGRDAAETARQREQRRSGQTRTSDELPHRKSHVVPQAFEYHASARRQWICRSSPARFAHGCERSVG
jgi:hypothetical protein